MRWAEEQRSIFIDDVIRRKQHISRRDLMDKFSISPATASRDLRAFTKEYPNLLIYNVTTKRYELNK